MNDHLFNLVTPMKLLLTSFLSGIYSMIVYAHISQTDFLAWSATVTTVISGLSLGIMQVWQHWKQISREEELKDKDICQAKLDEALARIAALSCSMKELKDQSDRWERIANSQNAKLNTVVNEVKEINSGLKSNE